MKACVRQTMAFPAFPASVLWTLGSLTVLWASVQSNVVMDDDPFQPVTTDETVSVGGTVTLTCRVMESDNSSLQWSNTAQQTLYFGDKRALRDNRIQLHRSTPTELSITIADVQLSDDGDYTCSIFTKPIRTARATVTVLGVPGKPQILTNNDAVEEGGTVTLICSSSGGKPAAKLRWYKGETELTGGTETVHTDPDDRTFTVRSELQLTVTREDNKAAIACTVDHPSLTGGDETSETQLSVLYSPIVHIEPETNLPREGAKLYLQCIGDGNPDPSSFLWEKKDGSLPSLVKADGSFLRFEQLNKSDNGVYLCQVDNGIGKGLADYTLLVQGHPHSDALYPTSVFNPSLFPSSPPASFPSSSSSPSLSFISSSLSSSASSLMSASPYTSPPLSMSTSPSPLASSSLSNSLFPSESGSPSLSPSHPLLSSSLSPSLTPSSVPIRLNGLYSFTDSADSAADPTAMSTSSGVDHAVIGGVVAVIVFILLCLLIVLGRYLIRHKGTYLTHEAKGSDDAPDADTAIINAEGGHSGADDKKEYFI